MNRGELPHRHRGLLSFLERLPKISGENIYLKYSAGDGAEEESLGRTDADVLIIDMYPGRAGWNFRRKEAETKDHAAGAGSCRVYCTADIRRGSK